MRVSEQGRNLASRKIWVVLQLRVPFRVLFIRVPYYIGDPKRDPNFDNYPYGLFHIVLRGSFLQDLPATTRLRLMVEGAGFDLLELGCVRAVRVRACQPYQTITPRSFQFGDAVVAGPFSSSTAGLRLSELRPKSLNPKSLTLQNPKPRTANPKP